MDYNLTDTQKDVLRFLVGTKKSTLFITWTHQGPSVMGVDGAEVPRIMEPSTLRSLEKESLIGLHENTNNRGTLSSCEVEVLQGAIDIVGNDFLYATDGDWIDARISFRFLYGVLDAAFNQEEIITLAFDLNLDPDALGATGAPKPVCLERLIRMIVTYNLLGKMIRYVDSNRPNSKRDWLELFGV